MILEPLVKLVTPDKMVLPAETEILEPLEKRETWEPQESPVSMVIREWLEPLVFPELRELKDPRGIKDKRETKEIKVNLCGIYIANLMKASMILQNTNTPKA